MKIINSNVESPNAKIAIVIARFNQLINSNLLEGAIDTLKRIGKVKKENITVVWVPGAYELPLIVDTLANNNKYNAIIALGTIIRGATNHFQFIASECSSGLAKIAIKYKLPIVFGVLTTENIEQAIERAGTKSGNKGIEAALTALEMINIINFLNK